MDGSEFELGKLKLGLMNGNNGEILVEYALGEQKEMETVPATDFLDFLELLSAKVRRFKSIKKKRAEKLFNSKTRENLKKMGINDFSYLARGME